MQADRASEGGVMSTANCRGGTSTVTGTTGGVEWRIGGPDSVGDLHVLTRDLDDQLSIDRGEWCDARIDVDFVPATIAALRAWERQEKEARTVGWWVRWETERFGSPGLWEATSIRLPDDEERRARNEIRNLRTKDYVRNIRLVRILRKARS